MPDTQQMLDRGLSVSEIRIMCNRFRSLSPAKRVHQSCETLLHSAVLDNCNHSR